LVAAVVVVAAAAAANQSALDKLHVVLQSSALGLTPEPSLRGRSVVLVDLAGSCHHDVEENSTAHSIVLAQQWHETLQAGSYHHGVVERRNYFVET